MNTNIPSFNLIEMMRWIFSNFMLPTTSAVSLPICLNLLLNIEIRKLILIFIHLLGLRRCIYKVYVAPQVHLTSFMFSVGETVKDLKLHLPTVVKLSRCFTSTNWHTCIPNLHRQPIFQSNSNFRINSNSRVFI